MKSIKIGVFGGSFNPIHLGHINILDNFIKEFKLDFVILIPNKLSPFKANQSELDNNNFKLNNKDILELLKLNTQKYNNIIILDYELNSNQINFSIDTFEYLKANILNLIKFGESIMEDSIVDTSNIEYYYLIGDDNLIDFQLWKKWEDLLNQVSLVVGSRNNSKADIELLIKVKFQDFKQKIFLLNNSLIKVSSTEVRKLILDYRIDLINLENNKINLIDNLGLITYNYLINNNLINKN